MDLILEPVCENYVSPHRQQSSQDYPLCCKTVGLTKPVPQGLIDRRLTQMTDLDRNQVIRNVGIRVQFLSQDRLRPRF